MRFTASVIFCGLSTFAMANDRPNTILVMDGSGSMWGQIDGVAKITIAQGVVTDLLGDFPDDQGLGLTVYGHRERGNCTDIETIVAPAQGTHDEIKDAVASISPLGKTPMTDAVIAAAEALRHTEDNATVILISDGVETCNPDPCAAARVLEETGVDFTAHVIGFDISDPEALSQMQCIADETGGQFLTADTASELTEALTTVAVAEPVLVSTTLEARLGSESGPLLTDPVEWSLSGKFDDERANPIVAELAEGSYEITAYRLLDEKEVKISAIVGGGAAQTVTAVFPEFFPDARLDAPQTAALGDTIPVGWTGPGGRQDLVGISAPDQNNYINYDYVRDGDPAMVEMPPQAGTYELRYYTAGGDVLAALPIEVEPIKVSVSTPETAEKGATIDVTWEGPSYDNDFIAIGRPGERYINYTYTREGSPLGLQMPAEEGEYEVRYVLRQNETIMATQPIRVTDVAVGLVAPDTAPVGSEVTIGWNGPDYKNDFISVGKLGDRYINYAYTSEGNPIDLLMPAEPGEYELRYQLAQDEEIIATRTITLTEVEARLMAPDTAVVGSDVMIEWVGPGYENDFISVGRAGESYESYSYTYNGNPLQLRMPTEPGDYELRYQLTQDNKVLAARPITLTGLQSSVTAPDTAVAGSTITVEWMGPDYTNDFISIGLVGERYENYSYTNRGNPLELVTPTEPGDYEIRYQLGQDNEVIASQPISIGAAKAEITAPETAFIGETISLTWKGPDYANDFIAVGPVNESYDNYTYTSEGSPLDLEMSAVPGAYEIRYILEQDRTILQRVPITLLPLKVQLMAEPSAKAGEELIVGWDGPDYARDFIAISKAGENGFETYSYTQSGSPVSVELPEEPGDYEVRYYLEQDRTVVASIPLTITD